MLTVEEYSTAELELDDDEVHHLSAYVRSAGQDAPAILHGLTPTRSRGLYRVTAGGYIGSVGLPSGRTLNLSSRFRLLELVWLLSVANRFPVQPDSLTADAETSLEPVTLLAPAFVREVNSLIAHGLAKSYTEHRFIEPPYPGRIDASYHLGRMAGRPDKLATLAKRLTVDAPVNQILAAAVDVLQRAVPGRSQLARQLRGLGPAFRYVSRPGVSARDVGRIVLDRRTTRYRPALGLAELILRAESLAPLPGSRAGSSLVYFMPAVWEGFVALWVEHHCPADRQVLRGHGFPVTTDEVITGRADVLIQRGGRPEALYDAKYKQPSSAPSSGDLFQMITYCERLGLNEATLVYPVDEPLRTVEVGNRRVHLIGFAPTPDNMARVVPPTLAPTVGHAHTLTPHSGAEAGLGPRF
jgi:5-methylcytosine-specific restriction endonuclease McrBC regulatory subunit McrC